MIRNNCLTYREVLDTIDSFYHRSPRYAFMYSRKTVNVVGILRRKYHVSCKRIFSIQYLYEYKMFEVHYYKRHYGNTGIVLVSK